MDKVELSGVVGLDLKRLGYDVTRIRQDAPYKGWPRCERRGPP